MPYLSSMTHSALLATPEIITSLYNSTRAAFVSDLGPGFSGQAEDHLRLAFCSVVAFDLKAYGPSTALSLRDLLAAPQLDCDNYCALAWRLFKLMRPLSETRIAAVGWHGGAVGNHAQLQASTSGSPDLYLDPTIGLVVHGCSLNALCRRHLFASQYLKSFYGFNPRLEIFSLEATVQTAIATGQYQASDLLYFAPGIDNFTNLPGSAVWATPQSWNIV